MASTKNQTQNDLVLRTIKARWLTQNDALQTLGVGRLAARINDLREIGTPIKKKTVSVKTANGGTAFVAAYRYDRASGARPAPALHGVLLAPLSGHVLS